MMKQNIIKISLAILLFIAGSWALAALLTGGLMRQYGLNTDADILILGHSHIMLALNKELMEQKLGLKVAKYTREGVTVAERKLMADYYLRLHPQNKPKYVFYGVDPYLFTMEGLSQNSYLNFLPFLEDREIDKYVRQNASRGGYWQNKLLPLCRFSDSEINAGLSGWFRKNGASLKTGKLDLTKTKAEIAGGKVRQIKINPEAVAYFRETIALFTLQGIKVILLNTPIIDLYNQLETDMHAKADAVFQKSANESSLVEYWNLNPGYETRYELFRDPIHLNRDGQKTTTLQVIDRLKRRIL